MEGDSYIYGYTSKSTPLFVCFEGLIRKTTKKNLLHWFILLLCVPLRIRKMKGVYY